MKTNLGILFGLFALTFMCLAQTNTQPLLPGTSATGQIDTLALINLAIMTLTPFVIQGIKKLVPLLPHWGLTIAAPLLGAAFAYLLNLAGVSAASAWGGLLWGGLATWLYELAKNVKEHMAQPETPVTPPTT